MIIKDLKILELASVLAGPSVGQFFGELGAQVLKVENLKSFGDVTRTWKTAGEDSGDISAYFSSVNWAKKSLAIDQSRQEGRSIVQMLAAQADIVIASYKPGDAEKLGVDYKTVSAINPRIIYGEITGYGNKNNRVGYDAVIQAEAGFMDLNGETGGRATKMPVALMDILAAHHLKEGLLLALLKRGDHGTGEKVEVSLIQAAISSLANQASNWLVNHQLPRRQGSSHPNIAPYGDTFETADGKWILLAVGSDQQFANLCAVLEIPSVTADPRFVSNQSRVENRDRLNDILSTRIMAVSAGPLLEKIHALKVPAGFVQDIKAVFEMPEAKALLIQSRGLTGVTGFVAGVKNNAMLPPPHFGEHNVEVLTDLGFDLHAIDALRTSQVIS